MPVVEAATLVETVIVIPLLVAVATNISNNSSATDINSRSN